MTARQMTRLVEDIAASPYKNQHGERTLRLSPGEQKTLHLCADGFTREEIAAKLHVGPETVKSQSNQIRAKLGARNITHAVAIAIREGVI
jgi:DNA-binding CsgD family transcriptional regulator